MIQTVLNEKNNKRRFSPEMYTTLTGLAPDLKNKDCERFFDLSSDMHCIVGFDGYLKKVNPVFAKTIGYTEEQLLSRPFMEFVMEDEHEKVSKELGNVINGNVPFHFEFRFRSKNGTGKLMAWRSFAVAEEKVMYTIGRDITEEKRTEVLLKEQAAYLSELVSHKNDGLQYARLLQDALLHDPKTINLIFPESFVFHSSKDIIGGDFYWFEKIGHKAFVACADGTGHGVPGAMLSVLGLSKLNEIISSLEFPPSRILDKLHAVIYKALGKKYSVKKINDGMDMSLYSVDHETNMLNYAGANNSLYIVRAGELIELAADKQSIGNTLDAKSFTDTTFQLEKGDMIYTFTDGYADQFGGERNKKFTRNRFKNLLTSIADKNAASQKIILEQTLNNWKQNEEQTDDVCVIGVRID